MSLNVDINSTFNIENLIIYKTQSIPNAPIDIPTSLSLSLAQKKHSNATLDTLVFYRDGEV
jgi:hypothetical protein